MGAKKVQSRNKKIPERNRAHLLYVRYLPDYETAIRKINNKIRNLISRSNINVTIKQRIKSFESYFEKLLRLHNTKKNSIKIKDILGIRVICSFLEDLEEIEKIICGNFNVIEIQRKGSREGFTDFGYDSIHILIKLTRNSIPALIPNTCRVCEIQLRTILQDAWAEIEHELIYKANFSLLNNPIKRKLASLNATLTLSDIIFQEIRDYQKGIQQLDYRRRESLQKKLVEDEVELQIAGEDNSLIAIEDEISNHVNGVKIKDDIESLLFDALEAHGNSDYDRAISIYTKIINKKPKPEILSIIYNHRGMAFFVQSKYKRSIKDFENAIGNNPKNFRACNNLGMTYRMLQDYNRALTEFNRSIEINHMQVDAYYNRALTYLDINNYTAALSDCIKVLNIKPRYSQALKLKKLIHSKLF